MEVLEALAADAALQARGALGATIIHLPLADRIAEEAAGQAKKKKRRRKRKKTKRKKIAAEEAVAQDAEEGPPPALEWRFLLQSPYLPSLPALHPSWLVLPLMFASFLIVAQL